MTPAPPRRALVALTTLLLLWQALVALQFLVERGLPPWNASRAGALAPLGLLAHDDDALFERAMDADWPTYVVLRDSVPPGSVVLFATSDAHASATRFVRMENLLPPTRVLPWNLAAAPATGLANWRPPAERPDVELYLLADRVDALELPSVFAPVENEHGVALWRLALPDSTEEPR